MQKGSTRRKPTSDKIIMGIIIGVKIIIPIVLAVLLFFLIAKPRNGRKYTVHIIDTIVPQPDPPAKKLLKYMEEKYDTEFVQVNEEPDLYSVSRRHHSFGSGAWDHWYNGITVTKAVNGHEYYHVRDDYGTYLDNYGCYLINSEAKEEINKKLSAVIDGEVKAACFPSDLQYEQLPAHMTVEEYLDNANYWLGIAICGKGETAEQDYEKICSALDAKSGEGWMTLLYLDEEKYNKFYMNNWSVIVGCDDYNLRLSYEDSEPVFITPEPEEQGDLQ